MKSKKISNSLFKILPRRSRRRLLREIQRGEHLNFAEEILRENLRGGIEIGARDNINIDGNEENLNYAECSDIQEEPHVESSSREKEQLPLVHQSCEITLEESKLLITAFSFKHNLTKSAIQDLLTLLRLHMPVGANVPSSHYLLTKDLNLQQHSSKLHYVCQSCKAIVDIENIYCSGCGKEINQEVLMEKNSYFYTFDPAVSLKMILEDGEVSQNLFKNIVRRNNQQENLIEDIVSGTSYQTLNLGAFDFTCSISTDGVSPFRSSQFSLWPVLMSINELDYYLRRNTTFLVGLWYSSEKPNFTSYLKPIIESLNALSVKPLHWSVNGKEVDSLVFFPIFVADSVARCVVQGINQFNGAYGCPWCLHKGETIWITSTNHKWIYPPCRDLPLRTEANFLANLETYAEMLNTNPSTKHFNGIKYASPLLLLKKFNIVDGFIYDVMHSAFLGVSRMFTHLWLDSCNSAAPYYMGNKIKILDKVLLLFKVPYEFDRTLRSLGNLKNWKASEWRSWTFVSHIVTKGVLPDVYRNHFLKFTNSVMLLSDEKITPEDLMFAEDNLKNFAFQARSLYGLKCCTFNLHLILHATSCVKKWGPLWSYSAFQYENFNGILTRLIRGSQRVSTQIRNRYLELVHIKHEGILNIQNPVILEFFKSLLTPHRFQSVVFKAGGNVIFLGPNKSYALSDDEKSKLFREHKITASFARSFRKCIVHGKLFNTEESSTEKRHNAVVATSDNKFYVLKKLLFIDTTSGMYGFAVVNKVNVYFPVETSSYVIAVRSLEVRSDIICLSNIHRHKYFTFFSGDSELKMLVRLPNIVEME